MTRGDLKQLITEAVLEALDDPQFVASIGRQVAKEVFADVGRQAVQSPGFAIQNRGAAVMEHVGVVDRHRRVTTTPASPNSALDTRQGQVTVADALEMALSTAPNYEE